MRTRLLIVPLAVLVAPLVAAAGVQACDAKAEIEAAFTAQHQHPWRTESASKSDTGMTQSQVFDFAPPDRIYRKVTSGAESVETVGIGKQAWTNATGAWEEMKAELALLVSTHMKTTFAPPRVSVAFKCLGPVDFEGRKLLGYQTEPETVEGKVVARTIYVDPETKLPAFNVVGTVDGKEELMKEAYSYPKDVTIEKPL